MNKEEFYKICQKLILPLFTGSYIDGEEPSSLRDNEIAYGKQNSLLIKPDKSDEYRLVLKRGQPFQAFEVNLLKSIITEINIISGLDLNDENYTMTLQTHAIEKAICSSITTEEGASTLVGLVNEMSSWANRTYEGSKVDIGIIVNQSVEAEEDSLHFSNLLDKDFFCLLSDGRNSFVEFDINGYLIGHVQINKIKMMPTIAPREYEQVARYCNDRRIGLVLTHSGDILIFKNRQLLFSKRRGVWNVYSHDEIIQLLSYRGNYSSKEIRKAIYYTALDCAFAYSGGIIVYLNKDMEEAALTYINANDILDERYYLIKKKMELENANKLYNLPSLKATEEQFQYGYEQFLKEHHCYKSQALSKIIAGKNFAELNRKLRQELVAMDGATIVDFDGTIIAVGAILKIEAGSEGGGRLAATTTLARCGNALKISQDGIIQAFTSDKRSSKPKNIFNVG